MSAPARIGLTLSGGGFRATLFHLGVIRFLFENELLPHVTFISGVSGGSIAAAHAVLNWDKYVGTPDTFAAAADELLHFIQGDLRNRILRRWILGWAFLIPRLSFGYSRSNLLIAEYSKLYRVKDKGSKLREAKLCDLYPRKNIHRPRIIFQTTSLSTGFACAFGRSGFMWYEEDPRGLGVERKKDEEKWIRASHLPVAVAVAASSAFPPMFPPVELTCAALNCNKEVFPQSQYLTDGGVFDNLGIDRPVWYYREGDRPDLSVKGDDLDAFVVSDAEGIFNDRSSPFWFKFTVPRNVRTTDILMKRMSTLTYRYLSEVVHPRQKVVSVGISDAVERADWLNSQVQAEIKRIRTDLDRFSPLEIECLITHGYEVARQKFIEANWIDNGAPPSSWSPVSCNKDDRLQAIKLLIQSQKRRWISLLDPRDWRSWIISALTLLFFVGLVLLLVRR